MICLSSIIELTANRYRATARTAATPSHRPRPTWSSPRTAGSRSTSTSRTPASPATGMVKNMGYRLRDPVTWMLKKFTQPHTNVFAASGRPGKSPPARPTTYGTASSTCSAKATVPTPPGRLRPTSRGRHASRNRDTVIRCSMSLC